MDRSKRKWIGGMELKMETMALLHQYYLAGIARESFSEEKRKEAYWLLERIESVLTQSGYLSEADIRLRHAGVKKLPVNEEPDAIILPTEIQ
jgi:hypothetical protein